MFRWIGNLLKKPTTKVPPTILPAPSDGMPSTEPPPPGVTQEIDISETLRYKVEMAYRSTEIQLASAMSVYDLFNIDGTPMQVDLSSSDTGSFRRMLENIIRLSLEIEGYGEKTPEVIEQEKTYQSFLNEFLGEGFMLEDTGLKSGLSRRLLLPIGHDGCQFFKLHGSQLALLDATKARHKYRIQNLDHLIYTQGTSMRRDSLKWKATVNSRMVDNLILLLDQNPYVPLFANTIPEAERNQAQVRMGQLEIEIPAIRKSLRDSCTIVQSMIWGDNNEPDPNAARMHAWMQTVQAIILHLVAILSDRQTELCRLVSQSARLGLDFGSDLLPRQPVTTRLEFPDDAGQHMLSQKGKDKMEPYTGPMPPAVTSTDPKFRDGDEKGEKS